MIESDHRALIVEDGHFNHILLAQDILMTDHANLDLNMPVRDAILHRLPTINKESNILEAIHFLQESVEYIAAVDDDYRVFGIISHRDLMNATDPEILMENYSIGEIIKSQKNDIWVSPSDKTSDVIAQMKKHSKDCATVIENNTPIGIFTIKDVLTIYRQHKDSETKISEFMTSPIETVKATMSIKESIDFIKNKSFKRLVVVNEENKMVGMGLQKELITLAYSHWASLMKQHHKELLELNNLLSEQADRYKHLAAIDPLTSLFNRYKFIELFTTELHAMEQREQPMSMLMLDIDHFKQINDSFGHNAGDDVLVGISDLLKTKVRNIDIVSRWGGEEFIILLPTATLQQARTIAEKIRIDIEQQQFAIGLKITISIGVHQVATGDKLEESISKADRALYKAKLDGRNCVAAYTE